MPAGYRIEIDMRQVGFSDEKQQEFVAEARRAGFKPVSSRYTLSILNLSVEQARAICDGLAQLGIHASIGVPVEPSRIFENYIPRRDNVRRDRR